MKYLIAILPVIALSACISSGGGGGIGSGTGTGTPGSGGNAPLNIGDVAIIGGTDAQNDARGRVSYTAYDGTQYTYITNVHTHREPYPNRNITGFTVSGFNSGDAWHSEGQTYNSESVQALALVEDTRLSPFGNNGITVHLGLSGTQVLPSTHTNQSSATYEGYIYAMDGYSPTGSRPYDVLVPVTLNADFTAGTFAGNSHSPSSNNIPTYTISNGVINGGQINAEIAHTGGQYASGTGRFEGGFYGTNELVGVFSTTTTNGSRTAGIVQGQMQ